MSDDKNRKKGKGLSDQELNNKIDLYQKFTTEPEQGLKFEEMRAKYKTEISNSEDIQRKQEIHHGLGEMKGLHRSSVENVKDAHEYLRQKYRDELSKDADKYYDQNLSLKKNFSNQSREETLKNKKADLDIEKG